MSDLKTQCWRQAKDCDLVVTGAVQSTWYVCRTCKQELAEHLYNKIKQNQETNETKISDSDDPPYGFWGDNS